ncbi:MAG: DapH/DapD/GlmU-related protein [Saprospiraceae bacterium]|nr:N-acetyltransferase [Saprospiraceae bacterium]MCB9342221.1 N-acetyltransferase [Lewinellaceae bacterium]
MSYFAHPSAIIDPGAQIGQGTRIWHFCHVSEKAVIGGNCVLGQNVFVADRVRLGHGVKVQNNVSIYTGVICENDVFLGPSMVFTNVTNPRSFISRKLEFQQTLVKKGATIGANATVICGITLGQYCLIGAGAVVTKDVPDFALITGVPGVQQGWVSKYGHKLDFDGEKAVCPESGEEYILKEGVCSLQTENEI